MIGISGSLTQNAYSPSNDPSGRAFWLTSKGFVADGSNVGAVFSHGAGGSEADAWMGAQTNLKKILGSVAQAYPVLAPAYTAGGDKWGNATAVLQHDDAVNYVVSQGCRGDKVLLFARSMGQLYAMNWARQNPSKVLGIVTFEGVADLQAFRTSNPSSVDAAFSGGYSNAAYGATYNPTVYAASGSLNNIPMRLYYATDDTTVPASTTLTLASLINGAEAISMGTGGHSDAPLANVDLPDLLDWIDGLTS